MMDKGVTVLFVSHSLEQVKRICTKAMILEMVRFEVLEILILFRQNTKNDQWGLERIKL